MGFFSPKATCSICGAEVGLNRYQIADKGWICASCFKKSGFNALTPIKKMTIDQIHTAMDRIESDSNELASFHVTKSVGSFLHVDEDQKKWYIPDGSGGKVKHPHIHQYSDIMSYELLEDGSSVSSGGVGRALVGGALFGGVGAIVGGSTGKKHAKGVCEKLEIKITLNDMSHPVEYICFIESSLKKDGFIYKAIYPRAQECLSVLQLMCDSVKVPAQSDASSIPSSADEIMKFKSLLDSGAITQEEYDAKKKQLLGI